VSGWLVFRRPAILAEAPTKAAERSVQIEGTELTEKGQRARSNRNFRLGSI
jgi:hypothetical protein